MSTTGEIKHYKPAFPERNEDWAGTEMKIISERFISAGSFGKIYEVEAEVGGGAMCRNN